ncbi:MAG: tRNA uridine-5-carboxymethylaminomethyl(34) synthesis enzyme MnmG, partial [Bacteroidales bacterium]|nr:tRNA uridine-5-carboxymethylaminomethyl(34) synthesis enzyme MnmG [Bacteroidales bacterium]
LTPYGYKYGLISEERYHYTLNKYKEVEDIIEQYKSISLAPEHINQYLEQIGSTPIENRKRILELLSRPDVTLSGILENVPRGTLAEPSSREITEAIEILIKYSGYIDREKRLAEKILRLENIKIPENFDFSKVTSLSIECRIKLERYRPRTIAQASRISGVSPADISVLLIYFGR